MAVILLPERPASAKLEWEMIDFGGTLSSPLGGSDQRLNRPGMRRKAIVTLPAMDVAQAMEWSTQLELAIQFGAAWRIRQPGFSVGSPGTVLVAGGAQAGYSLAVDGLRVGYTWRRGQYASVLTGGVRYLYKIAATARTANGAGALALTTPLRATPADNSPVELARPVIEGLLAGLSTGSTDPDHLARGFSFAIAERR